MQWFVFVHHSVTLYVQPCMRLSIVALEVLQPIVFLTQCQEIVSDTALASHQGTNQLQAAWHCMPS